MKKYYYYWYYIDDKFLNKESARINRIIESRNYDAFVILRKIFKRNFPNYVYREGKEYKITKEFFEKIRIVSECEHG